MTAGQRERNPRLSHGACTSPVPSVAYQHVDTGLARSELSRSTGTNRGCWMHGLTGPSRPAEEVVKPVDDPSWEVKRRPQTPSTRKQGSWTKEEDPGPL